jgi:hypothetical protein
MQGFDERATRRGFLFAGWFSRTTLIAGILKFHANIGNKAAPVPLNRRECWPWQTGVLCLSCGQNLSPASPGLFSGRK